MYYGYGFGRFLDPTYILVILAGVIALVGILLIVILP